MKENNITKVWELYHRGRDYNASLSPNQYDLVKTNTEFFIGNQWVGLANTPAMRALPKPTFNILKRVASLFIASLTSSGVTLRMEPLAYYDGGVADAYHDDAAFANGEIANLLEKFKFDYRIRDALFDGAQTGDYCAHFFYDPTAKPYGGNLGAHRGEIRMELVDGINVHFGNPNSRNVESQPYILLMGRDTVENLRREAAQYPTGQPEEIKSDRDSCHLEAADHKDAGKALYGLLYTLVRKEVQVPGEDGSMKTVTRTTVHATKATKNALIYEDVDTGLSRYPIAWGNWEKQKNQYHGRALVTGLIPNQIFINTMFATAMRHLQLMAFPKTVYNADLISAWTNEVGQAIGIHGLQPGQSISQVAYNLQPAEMSNQIFALIDKAMAYTKECLGATDAQMGNVRPDNTSALMVLQTNAEVPLENIRSGLYEWVEDCGRVLLDMMGTYYGRRPVVLEREMTEIVTDAATGAPMTDPTTGQLVTKTVTRKVLQEYDFSRFKDLWLQLRVDAGATTYFSEIAMTQTLDNLRRDGTLDIVSYLERIPDKLIPRKQELLKKLQGTVTSKGGAPIQGGTVSDDKAMQALPVSVAAALNKLPANARKTALMQGRLKTK